MNNRRTWKDDDMLLAISECKSISLVLKRLGLKRCGGNYSTVNNFIRKHNTDTSHFHGQLWNKGKRLPKKRPISDYLQVDGIGISSCRLKERIIECGLLDRACSWCGLEKWLDVLIPLELDHINGIRYDNRISNLRILCPNCHAQTPTYRGRNIKKKS